jgi:hypothetical protein
MRKRIASLAVLPMLMLAIMALMPMMSASAASQSHPVHFFLKNVKAASSNLVYHGGPVMKGTANVYAIYWEPTGNVQTGYNSLINQYFGDVNGSGLYHNNVQYKNSAGSHPIAEHLATSWVDSSAYPESPLLDTDIQKEVTHAKQVNGWSSSIDNIFFVFLQANENLCFDATQSQCASNYFCAYHSYFGTNTIYAAMPYAASFQCNPGGKLPNNNDADLTINVSSHEQMEAATDPLLNAWYDNSGAEIGDKCAWIFGPRGSNGGDVTWNSHSYLVQKEWDNAKTGCVLTGP